MFDSLPFPFHPDHMHHRIGRLVLIAGLLLLLGAAGVFTISKINSRTSVTVMPTSASWWRNIEVLHQTWQPHDTADGFPEGSRNQSTYNGVVGSHMAYTCCRLGFTLINGEEESTFDWYWISVNDFGTRFKYESHDWVHSRDLKSQGNDWQADWVMDYRLIDGIDPEKLGDKTESYSVVFTYKKGKTWEWDGNDVNQWLQWRAGGRITYNGFDTVVSAVPFSEQK